MWCPPLQILPCRTASQPDYGWTRLTAYFHVLLIWVRKEKELFYTLQTNWSDWPTHTPTHSHAGQRITSVFHQVTADCQHPFINNPHPQTSKGRRGVSASPVQVEVDEVGEAEGGSLAHLLADSSLQFRGQWHGGQGVRGHDLCDVVWHLDTVQQGEHCYLWLTHQHTSPQWPTGKAVTMWCSATPGHSRTLLPVTYQTVINLHHLSDPQVRQSPCDVVRHLDTAEHCYLWLTSHQLYITSVTHR